MPRPPPRTGSANWKAEHHRLSGGARENLIDALGLDPTVNPDQVESANQALAEVEKWLGFYSGADTALKNAPKASDFVRSLSSIENDTLKLQRNLKDAQSSVESDALKLLSNLKDSHQWIRDELIRSRTDLELLYQELEKRVNASHWIRDELAETGVDFQILPQELEKLLNASLSIKDKYEGIESRGPPTKEALRQVTLYLREVFARVYQGPILPRREIGAVRPLSVNESAEEEFIKFALDDAEIPYNDDDFRRLLNEPNVTVESERLDEIYDEKNIKRARDEQLKLLRKKKKKEKK